MFLSSAITQYWPPKPTFTEKHCPSQTGKIFIVTGGNQGVGFELIKILYSKGATIYMASRSQSKAESAIQDIASSDPSSASHLKFLHLDLNDLHSVRAAAKKFQEQEEKLDVLWNNAGLGGVPIGTKTNQGIEGNIGVNVIGPLLFTELLIPQLLSAAASAPTASVRVVWTSSWMMEGRAPKGGYNLKELESGGSKDSHVNYSVSKACNWFMSHEMGRRYGKDGIVSVCQNPGNLNTRIYDTQPAWMMFFGKRILHPQKLGAYTELFAGLSEVITEKHQGAYIIPWGRIQEVNPRKDIFEAIQKGKGEELWDWCWGKIKTHE
jgi:NAD(P)-dependent dehydrogenase (short-subunit alcohol dehydrogenase family)